MRMVRLGVTGHARIVGDENDGDALLLVEPLEHLEDLLARARIEVPRRLVREEHLGAVDERARDGDALLLAAGELGRDGDPIRSARPTFSSISDGPLSLLMLGEALLRVA